MKILLCALALASVLGVYGCNRGGDAKQDTRSPNDTTIQRQDDYQQSDVNSGQMNSAPASDSVSE